MGWVGRAVGSSGEKPGNIAAIAIVGSLIMIGLVYFFGPEGPKGELMTLFGGVITLALGYLFGRST